MAEGSSSGRRREEPKTEKTKVVESTMKDIEFFREIEHIELPWGERSINVPVFYYDTMLMGVFLLASIKKVREILPSRRLNPYRITPWHCVICVTTSRTVDCDLGPYNELLIGVPVTIDKPSPAFTATLRKMPEEPMVFAWHLPVTTKIALDLGVELAGYPKFLADIEFEEKGDSISCHASAEGKHLLTLKAKKPGLKESPRMRTHALTFRRGYLLRSTTILNERKEAILKNPSGVQLELGDHQVAQELRALNPGRILAFNYIPQYQQILTPVIESYKA
jgi:hypothetical protein